MKRFPIGFWNYAALEQQDETAVKDWADAGMTLAMGPNNSQKESTQAELLVRGRQPRLHRVGWLAKESSLVDSTGQGAEHGADYVKVRRWLAPGQMELFRLEDASAAAG